MKIINPDGTVAYPFGEPVDPIKKVESIERKNRELVKENKALKERIDLVEGTLYEMLQLLLHLQLKLQLLHQK